MSERLQEQLNNKGMYLLRAFRFFALFVFPFISSNSLSGLDLKSPWKAIFTDVSVEIDTVKRMLKASSHLVLVNQKPSEGSICLILNNELNVIRLKDAVGENLSHYRRDSCLFVKLPEAGKYKDTIRLYIDYEGAFTKKVREINFMEAYIGDDISYALSSSRWVPSVSGTDYRSKGKISYLVPENWTVSSTGKLSYERLTGSKRQYVYEITSPLRYSFVTAHFIYARKSIDDLDIGVYLLNGDIKKARFYLENTSRMVSWLREFYGMFPYENISLVEIPDALLGFAGGGSYEGLVYFIPGAFQEGLFSIPVFGHEIGHLWWGNYIRSPVGPVINEAFAQMSMGLYLESVVGEETFRRLLEKGDLDIQLWQTARLYFRFISPAGPGMQLLPGILHGDDMKLGVFNEDKVQSLHTLANSKGFFVIFMLRDVIGEVAFRDGLRNIMQKYPWSSDVTLDDLRREFEKAGKTDLNWFFDQWFFREGAPEFLLSYDIRPLEDDFNIKLKIRQIREVYKVSAEIGFIKGDICETRKVSIHGRNTSYSFRMPFKPDTVLFDPDYKVLRWINTENPFR